MHYAPSLPENRIKGKLNKMFYKEKISSVQKPDKKHIRENEMINIIHEHQC